MAGRVIGPYTLAGALHVGLPSLHSVARQLGTGSIEQRFRQLARQYVPDKYDAIMHAGDKLRHAYGDREAQRVSAFIGEFSQRYFPLVEWEELEPLTACIPFERHGWNYDEFHELDGMREPVKMLLLCVADPYQRNGALDGARVVLMEDLERTLGRDLLGRVPPAMEPEELHRRLDHTQFEGVAHFADWVWGATNTAFLDIDDEMEIYDAEWDPGVVEELTKQYHRAREILDQHIFPVQDWLERKPQAHFAMLVDALLADVPVPEPKPLIEVFANTEEEPSDHTNETEGAAAAEHIAVPAGAAD